jgi:hypothetical protein
MVRHYKDPSVIKIANAIKDGSIILVKNPPELALPKCLPFMKFKQNGVRKVLVDLTLYIREEKDTDVSHTEYHIDVTLLYALTLPAYLSLTLLDETSTMSSDVLYNAALLWSKMFNKVLVRAIGLATNRDRYIAFVYFGMRFFLKYYMEATDATIDSLASKYLEGNQNNYVITFMTEKINALGLNEKLYNSFTEFCTVIFNNDVSNIRGIRVSNIADSINTQFYVSQFITLYRFEALLSLANFSYFLFVLISVDSHADICSDKSIDDIIKDDKKLLPKLMTALYREIR